MRQLPGKFSINSLEKLALMFDCPVAGRLRKELVQM
jgi:hypothetical protein